MNDHVRYIGKLKVTITECLVNGEGRWQYAGTVETPSGKLWKFEELCSGMGGYAGMRNRSPESVDAIDRAAVEACSFASYYTTDNRGDDTPEWAPAAEVADEIEEEMLGELATEHSESENHFWVRRAPGGEVFGPYV